jgi:hypothetical protein
MKCLSLRVWQRFLFYERFSYLQRRKSYHWLLYLLYMCSIGLLTTVVTLGGGNTCSKFRSHLLSTITHHQSSRCAFVVAASIGPDSSVCASNSNNLLHVKIKNIETKSGMNLNDPVMPHMIGLGTYMIPREKIDSILRFAIVKGGYRRIDCAPVYFNEDCIGDTFDDILTNNQPEIGSNNTTTTIETNNRNDSNIVSSILQSQPNPMIQRSDLYVVSKLPSPFHRNVEMAIRKTLNDLRLEYLDLYLGTYIYTMTVNIGSIRMSNFSIGKQVI